jgi:RNA polymerase sigma factor (sigma-70 family)
MAENTVLLAKLRSGDRQAAAELMVQYGPLVRRRFRHRLGRAMRRLADSEDLWATVARRLDRLTMSASIGASSEREVLALLFQIAQNAICDQARVLKRLERIESEDSDWVGVLRQRLSGGVGGESDRFDIELDAVFRTLTDPTDRQILWLWLLGCEHNHAANELDMNPAAVRKRWQRIREAIRTQLLAESST